MSGDILFWYVRWFVPTYIACVKTEYIIRFFQVIVCIVDERMDLYNKIESIHAYEASCNTIN